MDVETRDELTALLGRWRDGDAGALDELMPLVYTQLRRVAQRLMGSERKNHTLQATALVHETYVHLLRRDHPNWTNRTHFFAVCSMVMRRALIDHARRRARRNDLLWEIAVHPGLSKAATLQRPARLFALDAALVRLTGMDPRKAQIVQMRFFGGLTLDEVAEVLQISPSTVVRDWRFARAWIEKELASEAHASPPGEAAL